METNKIKLDFVAGKLSDYSADAYVLPYYPNHESPSAERLDVAVGGALGVRDFISRRLGQIREQQMMRMGDCYITDARGGKSRWLVNIICRSKDKEETKISLLRGLNSMMYRAKDYQIKELAMPVLCVENGFTEQDFVQVLKEVLAISRQNCPVEQIRIVCRNEAQKVKLLHIWE